MVDATAGLLREIRSSAVEQHRVEDQKRASRRYDLLRKPNHCRFAWERLEAM